MRSRFSGVIPTAIVAAMSAVAAGAQDRGTFANPSGTRCDRAAAETAWKRTLEFSPRP